MAFHAVSVQNVNAQTPPVASPQPTVAGQMTTEPVPSPSIVACWKNFGCPVDPRTGEEAFCDKTKDKWIYDPEVTALGKGGDRARQFVYWVINTKSIDNSVALQNAWLISRNIMYALLVIVTLMMGAGIIIGQRTNFDFKVKIWPLLLKLALLLLYVTFSYVIILGLIQLSDILMQFFIKTTRGDQIFNIFFNGTNSEQNYITFRGCSNMNPDVLESVRTSKFLLQLTNITYYALGIAVILRKIVLWFLLMVAPFLALLAPFVFIRNVGWIWVGVFFQWLFYGPLFGLFLGGLALIWNSPNHIPFRFVFSKANNPDSIVFPTAINILYSGPANKPQLFNSSNYVDTFAEYVISLIMLWVVILLPWLLLRIFRDYCCDGIYAMKNILLSMYDNMKSNPPGGGSPGPGSAPTSTPAQMSMKMKQEKNVENTRNIENITDIKHAETTEINRSMNMTATKLTDIAHYETNKEVRKTVEQNISYLQNPLKATTATDRQKFMNLRGELFDRATKGDVVARQTLASISTSTFEQQSQREKIIETIPAATPIIKTTSVKVGLPEEKTQSVVTNVFTTINNDNSIVQQISQASQTTATQTQSVLNAVSTNQTNSNIVEDIAKETGVSTEKVKEIITTTANVFKDNKELVTKIAEKEGIKAEVVEQIIDNHVPVVADATNHIEDTVSIPPSVSIEDYEQVKAMWNEQYEKGEVPVSEDIKNRAQWVDTDIVQVTNIMNKILSSDPQVKAQGLEDVAYILPIFMINNMKGEELTVYLKAKLEAAKQVKKNLEKETEIKEKLSSENEEEFVDVKNKEQEVAEKVLQMSQEMPIEEEKKPEVK